MKIFANRVDAGKKLAAALKSVGKNAIVLAIPRGGVVVGYEVASALSIPLDVIITKKIGAPGNPELAIGAVAEDGSFQIDDNIEQMLNVSQSYIKTEVEKQKNEIGRRLKEYRGDTSKPEIKGREVILVDDGVATGSTLKAALRSLRSRGAKAVIVAVPVGPADTIRKFQQEADDVVCLSTPEPFYAIGEFYDDFEQTTDKEVIDLLKRNRKILRSKEVTI